MSIFNTYPTVGNIKPADTFLIWQDESGAVKQISQANIRGQQYVDSISDLKEINVGTLINGFQVSVAGYDTPGDGGGGVFIYDSFSSAVENLGTIVAPNVGLGRWLRFYSGDVNVRWFGAKGDGLATDTSPIQAAIEFVESLGGGVVFFPFGTYKTGVINIVGDRVTLIGNATILNGRITTSTSATNTVIKDLSILDDTGSALTYLFDINGTTFSMLDVSCVKDPDAGGYMGYIRQTASFGEIRGLRTAGSNGVFIGGHDHTFVGCQMTATGGDDCFVLKAAGIGLQTYNISIVGGSVQGFYNILAIGSEVGAAAAAGDYSSLVRNVTVTGVNAKDCTTIAFIKPGALGPDYRNGLVENIDINNCIITDVTGTAFEQGIKIFTARGAIVRNVRINNCQVLARATTNIVTKAGVWISLINSGAASTIENIDINNCSVVDVYDGVASGVGGAVGNPIDWGAVIEVASGATGTIGRVTLRNFETRGSRIGGIYVGTAVTGPIEIYSPRLKNVGQNPPSSETAGLDLRSTGCTVLNADITPIGSVSPIGRKTVSFYNAIAYKSQVAMVPIGTAAAGGSLSVPSWVAPKDCYVWKIELVNRLTITQSDADYSTYSARNLTAASNLFSVTTKTTGGIAILADTPINPLGAGVSIVVSAAWMAAGTVLRFAKSDTGAGQPADDLFAIIHYVPYSM